MPFLRSGSGTSAVSLKKPTRAQKNQPRGTPENYATADADGVELDNGTIPNQSKLTDADIPDDTEAATKSLESIATEAGELLNAPSNEDKPDTADLERVNNSAIGPEGRDTAHTHDSIDGGAAALDSRMRATTADTEDKACSSQVAEIVRPTSNDDKPDIADLEGVNNTAIGPDGRDTAHIHDSIHTGQATLNSKVPAIKSDIEDAPYSADIIDLTSNNGQYEFEDQLPNHEINSVASRSTPGDHNPSTTEQRHKRRLSDMSKTDHQSGESTATAIVIEEGSPRRRRKIRAPRFRDQIDLDNLWMLKTRKLIVKAQKFCDEEDKDLDEEQERLNRRKQRLEEQRDLLEDAVTFISSCGAHEQRFSRQLEKGT